MRTVHLVTPGSDVRRVAERLPSEARWRCAPDAACLAFAGAAGAQAEVAGFLASPGQAVAGVRGLLAEERDRDLVLVSDDRAVLALIAGELTGADFDPRVVTSMSAPDVLVIGLPEAPADRVLPGRVLLALVAAVLAGEVLLNATVHRSGLLAGAVAALGLALCAPRRTRRWGFGLLVAAALGLAGVAVGMDGVVPG